jgi:membrane carboxypeptidase/penicillin-binding protein PbpC
MRITIYFILFLFLTSCRGEQAEVLSSNPEVKIYLQLSGGNRHLWADIFVNKSLVSSVQNRRYSSFRLPVGDYEIEVISDNYKPKKKKVKIL